MAFKSWQSYSDFSRKVTRERRYIFDNEVVEFLGEVARTSKKREKHFKASHKLWRAQRGCNYQIIYNEDGVETGERLIPYPEERMFPLPYAAIEGRVNPKGIPCLYLATDYETAMSECRPWIGMEISVGQFVTKRDIRVVDCSENYANTPLYFDLEKGIYEPDDEEKEKAVWANIDRAFSTPINPVGNMAHYEPTQVIAELFKSQGYDGLMYKSMLGKGCNVALFDMDAVDLERSSVFQTDSLRFDFSHIG